MKKGIKIIRTMLPMPKHELEITDGMGFYPWSDEGLKALHFDDLSKQDLPVNKE